MPFLTPHERTQLLESLRPPAGYRLHTAIATTYSVDLMAMMVAPVGFTLFDIDPNSEDFAKHDPLEIVEAIRRHANQIVLFHEAGRIAVPRQHRPLFAYLEDRLIAVQAPKANRSFHPKVWVIRFANDAGGLLYRFMCLSRNLTFDRSWDTALILDGVLHDDRKVGFAENRGLRDFVAALPKMSKRPLSKSVKAQVDLIEREIGRVAWDLEGLPFDQFAFWPLGHDGVSRWPFRERTQRMVVVSPFLSDKTLKRLCKETDSSILVSRSECLDRTDPAILDQFESVHHMSDAVPAAEALDPEASPGSEAALEGLHAKLYIADDGWDAHTWTGSANATVAAFDGNVEFLVQLTGKKSKVGVDCFLEKVKGSTGFNDLLVLYEPQKIEADEDFESLEKELDALRAPIATAAWKVRVAPAVDPALWSATAVTGGTLPKWPEHVVVKCRPLSLASAQHELESGTRVSAVFPDMSFEMLTPYVVIDIEGTKVAARHSIRFVVNAELTGTSPNRREKLLRHMLQDPKAVLRFLLLLLADISEDPAEDDGTGTGRWTGAGWGAGESEALFEPLVRALDRSPGRLAAIRSLLDELGTTDEGKALIPDGLTPLFDAIWAAERADK